MPLQSCRSPDCKHKGSCGMFYPAANQAPARKESDVLCLVCLCGCFGSQHWHPNVVPEVHQSSTQPSTSQPQPPPPKPASSYTFPSSSSSKFTPNYNVFADKARERKDRQQPGGEDTARERKYQQQSSLQEGIERQAFDPASRIHQSAWDRLTSRPDKRKKSADKSKKSNSLHAPPAKKPREGKAVEYTFVLFNRTSAVDSGEACCPDRRRFTYLYNAGLVKPIRITDHYTPYEIDTAVQDAFAHVHHVQLSGWRLLLKEGRGQGASPRLTPFYQASPNITMFDLSANADRLRHSPKFGNVLFIALARGSEDISINGESDASGGDESNAGIGTDTNTDTDSDGPRNASAAPADMPPKKSPLPSFKAFSDDHQRLNPSVGSAQPPDHDEHGGKNPRRSGSPDLFSEQPKTCISDVHRLTVNLNYAPRPKTKVPAWWPTSPRTHFRNILDSSDRLTTQLDLVRHKPPGGRVAAILELILPDVNQQLVVPLDSLRDLASRLNTITTLPADEQIQIRADFADQFLLGPFGLHRPIQFLNDFYILFEANRDYISTNEFSYGADLVNSVATPLLSLLLHFRTSTDRSEYDPGGFGELREQLRTGRNKFGVADATDRLEISRLHIHTDSISEMAKAMVADFQHCSDSTMMSDSKLLLGEYGIDGFMTNIVNRLLDSMALDDRRYGPLMELVDKFCHALARRMSNYKKSTGKQKKEPRQVSVDPSNESVDGNKGESKREGASKGSEARYKTRSSAKVLQGGTMDNPLFIYDSDDGSDISVRKCKEQPPDDLFEESDDNDKSMFDGERYQPEDDCYCSSGGVSDGFLSESEGTFPIPPSKNIPTTPMPSSPTPVAPRAKFPYPETRGERTDPRPPPNTSSLPQPPHITPPPRPKPRPAYKMSRTPEDLLNNLFRVPTYELLDKILTDFPHPTVERRKNWEEIKLYPLEKRWYQVLLIYHPDKNRGLDEAWIKKCEGITKVLNERFARR
ncbi:hypothetical protein JAAARDRAFT_197537 [Jaapia argillacea MUCL 33604]|uniref:Uncharacterized protein n=1 Tax=Jaapia argillacea MUCL 33604 TaxID=933084 RepID=A0A067PEQ2_9AGAM|nr:hypothetical protein JAAARDRAFT_197537 [Jaapia argillacea MUCL 33604]